MKFKWLVPFVFVLLVAPFVPAQSAALEPPPARQDPTQIHPERDVSISAIPGIVASSVKWSRVWQQVGNSADGIVPTPDGSILASQGTFSKVEKIEANGDSSTYLSDTHGGGSLSFDRKGELFAVQRIPPAIVMLAPQRKIVADVFKGKPLGDLGNPNDLVADSKGGAYFTLGEMMHGQFTLGQVYYASRSGKITRLSDGLQTNGVILARNDKTLYVTNRTTVMAFNVEPDGMVTNQRELGRLEGGGIGDGMTIDSEGHLYIATNAGVQILGQDGKYLGLIPTPRDIISVCFGGPDRKDLYVVGKGSKDPFGQEIAGRSRTIYRLPMQIQGYKGRAK